MGEQEPQAVLDGSQHGRGNTAERLGTKPVDSQRSDPLAHCEADVAQPSVRRPHLDVDGKVPPCGS